MIAGRMDKRLLWLILIVPVVGYFAVRILPRLGPLVLDVALVALAVLIVWGMIAQLRKNRPARRHVPDAQERRARVERLRERMVALDERIEDVHEHRRQLEVAREETRVQLETEARPAMIATLRDNLEHYDDLQASNRRWLDAMAALRDVVREKLDVHAARQRALDLMGRTPPVDALDSSALIEETTTLDGELADLGARLDSLADRLEATAEIEDLVSRYR